MHNTCVTSTISLRTGGSIPSSFNGYTHCWNESPLFTDSSARTCCSCCFNTMYKVPRISSYFYDLFGLRQSSLIEWSRCRKLISRGRDGCYYARLTVCDADGSSYCEKIYRFRKKSVGWSEGGMRQCRVLEEKLERYDHGGVDVAEVMLSLLSDDISEECLGLRKETRKLAKKSLVAQRDDFEVSYKYGSQKKGVDLGLLESDCKHGHGSVVSFKKKKDDTRKEAIRMEEEKEALVLEENRRAESREEHEKALWSHKDYREDHGVTSTKKRTEKEFGGGSIVDCDFRKKSEKKLVDLSVQQAELKKGATEKGSKLAMTHESRYKESSDHNASYDDRQAKSRMEFDDERKQQHRQTSHESAKQSETKMKHKQFARLQDSHSDAAINSYGSQKLLSSKCEMSAKAASLSQKAVGKHRTSVEVSKMEDEYQRNSSHKVARESEIQEIDAKKVSSSQHRLREEDNSTNIRSSINEWQQSDGVRGLIQSRGESKQLAKKEVKSNLKRISENTIELKESLNLASGSSLESKELLSRTHVNILKGDNSRKGSDELAKISFSHSLDSGATELESRNKTKSEFVQEKQQQNPVQYSSGDFHPKKHSRHDDQHFATKGPADEIWNVDDPSVQEQSRAEVQNNATKISKAIVKGSGQSLWGVFSDFVRLLWFPRSESHGSGRKTGGRSSFNQLTSSETWVSEHDGVEIEEAAGDGEQKSVAQGLSSSQTERKLCHQVGDGSSLSTLEGHLKDVGINVPSSSKVLERGSQPISIPLHSRLSEKTESAVDEGEPKEKKLQQKDHFIEDCLDEWDDAYRLEVEQRRIDETFMREALLEAQKAADNWEVPVGAVLVHGGKIIARGCNLVEENRDSTAHAEMICIREASNMLHTWKLSGTTLYVTLEPCPMCAGAILQARINTVVWGAPNKLLGADGSWIRLFPIGDGGNGLERTDKPAAPVHPFHPNIVIRRGVLASVCADVMQQFFKLRRINNGEKLDPSMSPPSCLPIPHWPPKFLAKMLDALHVMFCL